MRNFSGRYGLSEELDEVQRSIEETLLPITSSEIIDGGLVHISLEAGTPKNAPHKLGRPYKGIIVVKKTGFSGTITENSPSNSSLYINLTASADADISVWVF